MTAGQGDKFRVARQFMFWLSHKIRVDENDRLLAVAEVGTQRGWVHHVVVNRKASSVQINSKKIIYHRN